jgi:asparagine synthase (glutamine-hydrolysing)
MYTEGPSGGWSNDDSLVGCSRDPYLVLGHRRLSILDLSRAGHQPMSTPDERYWITYNGEIYNFPEIRSELLARGHRFHSSSDTEVLLHGFIEWGMDVLPRLDGMFAFAIWDREERQLFIARDRLGIKPFYYNLTRGIFSFASEAKALICLPWVTVAPDPEALTGQISLLWTPEPKTPFAGITKLAAGYCGRLKDGELALEQYWDVPRDSVDIDSAEGRLEELLERAVHRRMISDVPVGAFLSGGLDSSLITASMCRASDERVHTYTIRFRHEDAQQEAMSVDADYARLVARQLGTEHREIMIDPDVYTMLARMVWHVEEPFVDPAAINTYLICEQARSDGIKVMLSGMGADEIFAGYRKHLSVSLAEHYKRLPSLIRRRGIEAIASALPVAGRRGPYRLVRWGKRFLKSASLPSLECFIGNSSYYDQGELEELFTDGQTSDLRGSYAFSRHCEEFGRWENADVVERMTYADTKLFLPSLNLAYSDKASMAASVEARVPFVDHEMAAFALNLPSRLRIRNLTQKYLLKKVAESQLSSDVVYRPKAPFGAPLRAWMKKDLQPVVDDLLSETSVKRRGYFNYSSIRRMIDDNRNGREDYAHRLWGLLTFELWHRIFIDGEISPPASSDAGAVVTN